MPPFPIWSKRMNIETLRYELRDLGFEDNTIFNDEIFQNTFYSSVTRALKLIANTVKAPTGILNIELNDTGRYDLDELTKEDNNVIFDDIERVILNTENGIETYSEYDFILGKILILNPGLKKQWYDEKEDKYRYSLSVIYRKRIPRITENFTGELPIEYVCEPLLGLLTAHYVWLDDDVQKATMYFNEYDMVKQEVYAKVQQPKGRIVV